MDVRQPEMVLLGIALIAILNVGVFYLIIRSAVNAGAETTKRMKHAWAQTELLIALARKQGVDETSLRAITDSLK